MKSTVRKQFDETDEEITDVLNSLGLSRPIAKTLSYLRNLKEATSVDLERVTGLHQPEVSIAMRDLKERDWISEREEKKPGKGRPFKVYSLKKDFEEIIGNFEKQKMKEINEIQLKIKRLKEMIVSMARSETSGYSGEASIGT
ncbi:MAG: transcriptional regulator protein [Candidatus Methanoperedens sp.]|nr:transcriptional regulator protein [Candidatus Methanoperedens sp.]MCZ7360770.1 transcriptional regulator protein [Candidatus Methanoperedens sp.]HLB71300.1 transcriptional regulator protein [Candidatus Methanoperedens sp.]